MLGKSLACVTHATFFIQATGEGGPGRVTLDSNKSKDKKRVLAKHAHLWTDGINPPAHSQRLRTSTGDMFSKDATLAITKLSKNVGG